MRCKKGLYLSVAAIAIAGVLAAAPAQLRAQTAVAIDNDDIGGTVTGANGPEAGVWVIAETTDLPTRYAKMVVTDDQGRYVVPDLPKAKYKVWVRGYGLVDSPKVDGEPGQQLNLKAVAAPERGGGGAVLSGDLLVLDAEDPGRQPVRRQERHSGEDHPGGMAHGDQEPGLRRLSPARPAVHAHDPGRVRRVQVGRGRLAPPHQSGQAAPLMINPLAGYLGGAPFKYFGDWTDRIAKGELPHSKPPRPQGVERNVVVTTWDWGNEKQYLHDLISSDRRNPTVNANGKLFGSPEYATDVLPILDPKTNTVTTFKAPVRDANMPEFARARPCRGRKAGRAVGLLGRREALGHPGQQPQLDVRRQGPGLARGGGPRPDNPDFCKKGSDHPSAKVFPIDTNVRAAGGARSADDEVHLRRHLFRIASPAVTTPRTGCGPAAPARWPAGST